MNLRTRIWITTILCCSALPVVAEDALAVLERVAVTLGVEQSRHAPMRFAGSAQYLGNEVEYRLEIGEPSRFRQSFGGPFPAAEGVDADGAWMRDLGGDYRRLDFSEAERLLVLGRIFTKGWLAPDSPWHFDDQFELTGDSVELRFRHANGHAAGVVLIDALTWRPRRFEITGFSDAAMVVEMSGSLADAEGWFPDTLVVTGSSGRSVAIRLESAEPATDYPAGPRPGPLDDTRFDSLQPAALEVVRARHGHLLVNPRINGHDLGWFLFDSGAGISVLDARAVATLDLQPLAQTVARGGGGRSDAPLHRVAELQLGPLTIQDLTVIELDLAFLDRAMGRSVAGIIGRDLFARAIVELDARDSAIALYDPARLDDRGLDWLPLRFEQRRPVVAAEFESLSGYFIVDTGDYGMVSIYPGVVAQHRLLEGRRSRGYRQRGVGGGLRGRRAELQWLDLGDHRLENIEAVFLEQAPSVSPWLSGRIGMGLLEPWLVVFDYSGTRMALISRDDR